MPLFVSTIQLTENGMKDVAKSCQRAEEFKSTAGQMGVTVQGLYWSLGAIDGMVIFDAPDAETASAAMLYLGSLGNVTTQTSRAFDSAEMQGVLGKLPG